jgi:hypothetical protein
MANLAFKAGIVGVLGGSRLLKNIVILFGINILVGLAVIFLWPA